MAEQRYSRQREAIFSYLQSTKSHPTAEDVYKHVQKEFHNISLGTVYRNLNLLVSAKEVLKINCGDGFERFDGNPAMHYHVICNQCGSVSDLNIKNLDYINKIANASFNGKIIGHKAYFYGICKQCYEKY